MFHVALVEPEIPPNTGNIIRLCANSGAHLHLIHPLGFVLDDARLRRAGLDYHEYASLREHGSLTAFLAVMKPANVFAFSTKGKVPYTQVKFSPGDVLMFGAETRGLPLSLLDTLPDDHRLFIPMRSGSRSLNLSNSVALVLYEAWRQNDFIGADRLA